MELTTDFLLRGPDWAKAIDQLGSIFKIRTNYEIFMVCLSIGIMYDQRLEIPQDPENEPRNVVQNNDNGKLDLMFQAAVLTTTTLDLTEEERQELAFSDKKPDDTFNRPAFLLSFANFGVTKFAACVGKSDLESMELIKNFLVTTMEGMNLDIDGLSDELLLEEEDF